MGICFTDNQGTTQVILGTSGEHQIQQALIVRINSEHTSEATRKECERLLEYAFGNFKEVQ